MSDERWEMPEWMEPYAFAFAKGATLDAIESMIDGDDGDFSRGATRMMLNMLETLYTKGLLLTPPGAGVEVELLSVQEEGTHDAYMVNGDLMYADEMLRDRLMICAGKHRIVVLSVEDKP